VGAATTAKAADPPPPLLYLHQPVAVVPSGCTFRFTPYGWLTSLHGGQTVRGRAVDVDASFVDIIDATLGSGGTLIGLMADFEARNGPVALFGDLVWTKNGVDGSGVRSRGVGPVAVSVGASADVAVQMAILEAGGAYEVARFARASREGPPRSHAWCAASMTVLC